jgi:hypothetical protein
LGGKPKDRDGKKEAASGCHCFSWTFQHPQAKLPFVIGLEDDPGDPDDASIVPLARIV